MFYQFSNITQSLDFLIIVKIGQNAYNQLFVFYFDGTCQGLFDTGIHVTSEKQNKGLMLKVYFLNKFEAETIILFIEILFCRALLLFINISLDVRDER